MPTVATSTSSSHDGEGGTDGDRGNLVPDAHLVALLRQHGVRVLYTNHTDFKKFAAIEARDPFGRDDGA
jgi:predicted nucleic acid-binding protein